MELTKRQAQAIDQFGNDLTVSASAGAGKTRVLIERITKQILSGKIDIDRILAMTFTSAAAEEMKKRLHQSLVKASKEHPEDQRIKDQLLLLPAADVSTIDSFCLRIIQNYSYLLGWDPSRYSNVLAQNSLKAYKKEAALNVIKNNLEDPNLKELSEKYETDLIYFSTLSDLIIKLDEFMSIQADRKTWVKNTLAYYQPVSSLDKLPDDFKKYYFSYYLYLIKDLVVTINAFLDYVSSGEKPELLNNLYKPVLDQLSLASKALIDNDYQQLTLIMKVINIARDPSKKKVLGISEDETYDNYKKTIKNLLKDCQNIPDQQAALNSLATQKNNVAFLIKLADQYHEEFIKLKESNNEIDFADMEEAALELLKLDFVKDELREHYQTILVDEYQDSNNIQETLIKAICNHNVFRVGDTKQSIYGFRNAKPELMQKLLDHPSENNQVITLDKNFRSTETIIEFNNQLYQKLMSLEGFEGRFSNDDIVNYGVESQKENNVPIDLEAFECEATQGLNKEEQLTNECKFILNKIQELRKSSELNHWRDYVILVRNNSIKSILEPLFKQAKIPYFFVSPSGYFIDNAVSTILSWLRLLADHNDDLSLISILRSAYYSINDEGLANLKLDKGNESYFNYLNKTKHPFISDYEEMSKAKDGSITTLLEKLFSLNDYHDLYTTPWERDNLDLLYQQGIAADNQNLNFEEFLSLLNTNEQYDAPTAIAADNDADVVRVMTVHNSKGLEFKHVFYLTNSILSNHDTAFYNFDDKLGLALEDIRLPYHYAYNGVIGQAIKFKQREEALKEEIRVMYVATTRAEKRLTIVGYYDTPTNKSFFLSGTQLNKISGKIYAGMNLIVKALKSKPECPITLYNLHIHDQAETLQISDEKIIETKYENLKYTKPLIKVTNSTPSSLEEHFIAPISLDQIDRAQRGTLLHKAFELIDYHSYQKENLVKLNLGLSNEDIDKIDKFFKLPDLELLLDKDIHQEYPFFIKIDGSIVHGVMDLVAIGKDEIILVDFKSDQNTNETKLLERYTVQLQQYSKVLSLSYPDKKVTAYLYSIENAQWIKVPQA